VAPATVLHVGPIPPPIDGGISAYLDGLLRAPLAQRYVLETFDVSVPEVYRRHRTLRAVVSLRFLSRYLGQLQRTRAGLVHIHTSGHWGFWEKALFGFLTARRGLPFVLHVHGGDFDRFLADMPAQRRRWAARVFGTARAVIVLSEAWRGLFDAWVAPANLHVVPNAIHVADFEAADPGETADPVRVLFVGMMSARKGLDELCTALVALRADGTSFQVDIVGGEEVPGDGARYRERFRSAGLGRRVRFHGLRTAVEIRQLLRRAHLFVLPSRSESFGIANLEAMASGLPVVSTRTGAIPEYIQHEEHGLLVDPGDAPGLTQALLRLIEAPELRQRLGAAARQQVQRFDWGTVGARIETIYRDILGTT
jgi:glycosyltransferase involved in cell wall biosynthesis